MASTVEVLPPLTAEAERHHKIWRSVNTVKKLSDRVVGIGPFGVGMDGLLTWIPGAGILYSVGAGAFLIAQALRAGARPGTVGKMGAYLLADAATSEIPLVGDAIDFLFPAHMMAANALQKDIEIRHGTPPEFVVGRKKAPKARRKSTALIWLILLVGGLATVWVFAGGEIVRAAGDAWQAVLSRLGR